MCVARSVKEVEELRLWVPILPTEVSARLERRLRLANPRMGGGVTGCHAEFHLSEGPRTSQSAQLVIEMEAADGGTWVRGSFTRHPHVFVISLIFVVVCVFGAMIALSYAVAQWSMGQAPSGLVGAALFGLFAGGAYVMSRSPLRGANAHTEELRKFVEEALSAR